MKKISLLIVLALLLETLGDCAHANVEVSRSSSDNKESVDSAAVSESESSRESSGQKGQADAVKESRLTSVTLPIYYVNADTKSKISVYYADGVTDIPYITVDSAVDMLEYLYRNFREDKDFSITSSDDNGIVTLERNNGTEAEVDFNENRLLFYDADSFLLPTYTLSFADILDYPWVNEKGEAEYFDRVEEDTFYRPGQPCMIQFSNHDIELIYEDGTGYLPLQTVGDMFLTKQNFSTLYNGDAVIIIRDGELGELADIYYAAPTGTRSKELAEFSYNELCLVLDMFYGLKEAHNIESFDTLFSVTGLKDMLLSENPVEADLALYNLCNGYLGDLHSSFGGYSFYAGQTPDKSSVENSSSSISPSVINITNALLRYNQARSAHYPDGTPAYEEIGNTAYVTFDKFTLPEISELDYYNTPVKDPGTAETADTIGLVQYAHAQIMRENSPIENVVIDLSNNTGGTADAVVYVVGWFLGSATININNTFTRGQSAVTCQVDVDGNHQFDENDTVASKNLYCLISPCSFSCGNLAPASFKSSDHVILLGKNSGGGACVVQPLTTADGSMFQISGVQRLSMIVNGSFYDIDQGIEPDISIQNIENFYDRKTLTDYINNLF